MRFARLVVCAVSLLPSILLCYLLLSLLYGEGDRGSRYVVVPAAAVVPQQGAGVPNAHQDSLATSSILWNVELSQKPSIEQRGMFQQEQIDRYCRKHGLESTRYTVPTNSTQEELLYRHLIYDDKRRSLFCFVEKIGCTDMKRLLFVTSGALPVETAQHSWVDLKYLEKGLRRASLANRNLTSEGKLQRIREYFKFTIVRNPLERLVSGYRNKIEPPLSDLSIKFPNYIKRQILKRYRPMDFKVWLDEGGRYNISISFPEFVQHVIDTDLEVLNPHFKPMIHTCHPCRVRYHFYGNFNMYGKDVALIIDKLRTKPEYYPNRSLHAPGHETKTYLLVYYNQLTHIQKAELFYKLKDELEFYYHLYPKESDCHTKLLGIHEHVQVTLD